MDAELSPMRIAGLGLYTAPADEHSASLRALLRERLANPPRRINRLIELALIGAADCIGEQRLAPETPVMLALSSGCVADSWQLLGDALNEVPAMPVRFINVSGNMTGFYVAQSFGLEGSCQVVSRETGAWAAALELAAVDPGCRRGALVAALEEAAWPMDQHRERLGLDRQVPVLETSAWLRLARDGEAAIGELSLGPPREAPESMAERVAAWAATGGDTWLDLHGDGDAPTLPELPRWSPRHAGYSGHADALNALAFLQQGNGQLIQLQVDADGRGSARRFLRLP